MPDDAIRTACYCLAVPIRRTLLLVALVIGCGQIAAPEPVSSPAAPVDEIAYLDVMSFNLRVAGVTPPHSWQSRRPVMAALLTAERPHLIGTQEGLAAQLDDIENDLGPAYDRIGTGRDGGGRGQQTAILYDTTRLSALASGHFWLSETPEVPGSSSWNSGYVRMVTWVRFTDSVTGREFYAVNAHLDNRSAGARLRGTRLLGRRLAAFAALPIVLTGDFNSPAGTAGEPYRLLTERAGLRDTWTAAPEHGPEYGTFHDYRPLVPGGPRIDWILTTPDVTALAALMNTHHEGRRYPSDHLPVQARIRLR